MALAMPFLHVLQSAATQDSPDIQAPGLSASQSTMHDLSLYVNPCCKEFLRRLNSMRN